MAAFDSPFLVFAIGFIVQVVAAYLGDRLRRRVQAVWKEERPEYDILRTAALTLLGLLIGFSFAMAVSRYDQRKNLEEAEANAIGTEYLRADLLPAQDAAHVRELLRKYTNLRIQNYQINDERLLGDIDAATAQLQVDMWSAVVNVSKMYPPRPATLGLWGTTDLINSQGYPQAACWNPIPFPAWPLMG